MNNQLRALFPVTERLNYLNHAAVSPPPALTITAIQSQLKDVSENGSVNFRSWIATKERLANKPYGIVSSRTRDEKSQIVCIQHRDGLSPMKLYSHLKDRGIITAPRGDRLRIAPHLYNTSEEIERLVNALP